MIIQCRTPNLFFLYTHVYDVQCMFVSVRAFMCAFVCVCVCVRTRSYNTATGSNGVVAWNVLIKNHILPDLSFYTWCISAVREQYIWLKNKWFAIALIATVRHNGVALDNVATIIGWCARLMQSRSGNVTVCVPCKYKKWTYDLPFFSVFSPFIF